MRSLISGQWKLVEELRGGLEVAGPREAAMKPSREDEAAPAGGPWEECFEVAVQLALRAGQVSAAALLSRSGRVRVSAAPPGRAGTLSASHPLGTYESPSRSQVGPKGLLWARDSRAQDRVQPRGWRAGILPGWGSSSAEPDPRSPAFCGGRLVTADPGVIQ